MIRTHLMVQKMPNKPRTCTNKQNKVTDNGTENE